MEFYNNVNTNRTTVEHESVDLLILLIFHLADGWASACPLRFSNTLTTSMKTIFCETIHLSILLAFTTQMQMVR